MEIILLLVLLLILYVTAPWLVRIVRKGRKYALLTASLISLVLVPVSLLLLNQHDLVAAKQNAAIEWAGTVTESTANKEKQLRWTKEHFLFVDDSYSNQLLPLPGSNQLGSSTIVVTNRTELAKLFRSLSAEDSLIDFIICDIYFDINASNDSILRDAMASHIMNSKLLLAHNRLSSNTDEFASFNDSVYASINEKEIDGRFSTYSPVQENRPTLAYMVYRKMFPPAKEGLHSYIPRFHLVNEDSLYVHEDPDEETNGTLAGKNYYEMGDIVTETGGELLHAVLEERKRAGMRNVIFIGSFRGEDIDVHPTYFGRLHGPTIILNLIYSLFKNQHRTPISYLLYLWIGITIVIYAVISLAVNPFTAAGLFKNRLKKISKHKTFHYGGTMIIDLVDLILIKGLFTGLLVGFIVATVIVWDRILNGFMLFLLVHAIHIILHHFAPKTRKH